jgi:hypothetical protein
MVLFESMAGVKLTPIHFRGGAPLVTDLLGGHVPMSFSAALVDQGIKAGKLRPIAIASRQRLPQYPDVPTVAESGVPGFEAVSWYGLWAPSGTPREVVGKINADVQKVFADADFREKFLEPNFLGSITGNADAFAAFIKAEAGKWSKVIRTPTSRSIGPCHRPAAPHAGALTTAVTLSISRFSAFLESAGIAAGRSMPAAVSCFLASGVLTAATASAVILSMIGCGRPGRPYRPTMVARS